MSPGRTVSAAAAVAGVLCALIGAIVLAGWVTDQDVLRTFVPGGIMMLPNPAVGFILAGLSLWLLRSEDLAPAARRAARAAAAAVFALGLLTFVERVFGWDFGIDLLLFPDGLRRQPYRPPGRMATNSTVCFALAGGALLLTDVETRRGWRPAQILAAFGLAIASLALMGHLYGARPLYAIDRAAGMAVPTALAFFVLHAGILFARSREGGVALLTSSDAAGMLARRLLPATILAPLLFGWLWIEGREREVFSREGGVALFVIAVVGVLVALVLRSAYVVRIADGAREALLEREASARHGAERATKRALEAAAEAERARSEAEAASRAKSDFLATMSHELRTPLNAIIGYTNLLADGIPDPVTERQRGQLARVNASARHLLELIDEVLTLSRLEAGREVVSRRDVAVADVLDQAAAMIEPMAHARRLRLDVRRPSPTLTIETDAGKLRQILLNLLTNAVKFTDEGSVVLSAEEEDGDSAVAFRVTDTGIGIAREHQDRIFESFWQIEQTTTRRVGGAGLGLNVARQLARLLGGDVTVESAPGEGSTFTVRLPRRSAGGRASERAVAGQGAAERARG
ncbi:MAG: sensor histidine kinase [Gemmatimonadaceae bacterium]